MNYSDTMKRTANIRKFDDSILGGDSRPWNINIAPMSSGNYDAKNSFKKDFILIKNIVFFYIIPIIF
jgi:hypothetical protein